jgi:tetratricopeptide (TPR) repeat protein
MAQKNYQGADYDYVAVLLIDSNSTKTYAYRGLAESFLLDTANMRTDFERAVNLGPHNEQNFILWGRASVNLKEFKLAQHDFDTAITLNPNNPEGWYYRGLNKINQGDSTGCTDLRRSLDLGLKEAADALKRYCR